MEVKLSIIIPIYNEEESLKAFLPEIIQFCSKENYKLILVDDGSKDNSFQLLKEMSEGFSFITIYKHWKNIGYGAAIKTGLKNTSTQFVVTIDADGQHYLSNIKNLVKCMLENKSDLIIGTRKEKGFSNIRKRIGKWMIRKTASFLLNSSIKDLNSGMKMYDTKKVKKYLKLCPNGMAFSDVITLVFISYGDKVIEQPINIRNRKYGKSKINYYTALSTFKEIISIALLFNPFKFFSLFASIFSVFGIIWAIPFLLNNEGLSVGALFLIITGFLFFFIGLLAEQISIIRREFIINDNA